MTLKQRLEYHYKAFDRSQIVPDPLQFLHLFNNEEDIETAGFISSVFAYGNVRQIINTLNRIFEITGNSPYDYINTYKASDNRIPEELKHRFYTQADIKLFFSAYHEVLKRYGSLKKLFLENYNASGKNIREPLNKFSSYFLSGVSSLTPGIKFMFPVPEKGSSCKRMNLFLRWMVRKDDLDFGIWKEITPDKLIIPVDTHIARICTGLGLTTRKNVSWKMAEEITDNLRRFDPYDPVKYDFAICHIGMRKLKF